MVTKAAKNKDIKTTNFEESYNNLLEMHQNMQKENTDIKIQNKRLNDTVEEQRRLLSQDSVNAHLKNLENNYTELVKAMVTLQAKHAALEGLVQNIVRNKIKPQTSNQEILLTSLGYDSEFTENSYKQWIMCLNYFNLNGQNKNHENAYSGIEKFLMAVIIFSQTENKLNAVKLSYLIKEITPYLPVNIMTFFISINDNIPKETFKSLLSHPKLLGAGVLRLATEEAAKFHNQYSR